MPTDEWFKENPKISAYISPNLNQKLSEWMKNRGVKKVSQALTTILESYLGVNQDSPNIESSENDRLRIVEQKLESLSQEVRSLTERNEKNNQRVVQTELFLVKPLEETLPDNEEIALINTEQPIEVVEEEIPDDEPDEILFEFLETEKQATNPGTQKEAIEITESNQAEENSPRVEESSSFSEIADDEGVKPIMTNEEVRKLLDESINTIKSRNTAKLRQKGKGFTAKGYQFTAIEEGSKPRWKVEKLEDKF